VAETEIETQTDLGVLARSIEDFWGSMLGLDVERCSCQYERGHDREILGTVSIMGDWSASLVVRLPESLATDVTAAMFAMEPGDVTLEELGDAIGEIANVAAGALKGAVDADCRLSLPSVTEGSDLRVGIPGASLHHEACFTSGSRRFAAQVWVRDE